MKGSTQLPWLPAKGQLPNRDVEHSNSNELRGKHQSSGQLKGLKSVGQGMASGKRKMCKEEDPESMCGIPGSLWLTAGLCIRKMRLHEAYR